MREKRMRGDSGEVDRANACEGFPSIPEDREDAFWGAVSLSIAVPFGLMFLWAGVMW